MLVIPSIAQPLHSQFKGNHPMKVSTLRNSVVQYVMKSKRFDAALASAPKALLTESFQQAVISQLLFDETNDLEFSIFDSRTSGVLPEIIQGVDLHLATQITRITQSDPTALPSDWNWLTHPSSLRASSLREEQTLLGVNSTQTRLQLPKNVLRCLMTPSRVQASKLKKKGLLAFDRYDTELILPGVEHALFMQSRNANRVGLVQSSVDAMGTHIPTTSLNGLLFNALGNASAHNDFRIYRYSAAWGLSTLEGYSNYFDALSEQVRRSGLTTATSVHRFAVDFIQQMMELNTAAFTPPYTNAWRRVNEIAFQRKFPEGAIPADRKARMAMNVADVTTVAPYVGEWSSQAISHTLFTWTVYGALFRLAEELRVMADTLDSVRLHPITPTIKRPPGRPKVAVDDIPLHPITPKVKRPPGRPKLSAEEKIQKPNTYKWVLENEVKALKATQQEQGKQLADIKSQLDVLQRELSKLTSFTTPH